MAMIVAFIQPPRVLSGAPSKQTPEYKVLRCSFLLADGLLVDLLSDPGIGMP
jgi:hypothetical protein